MVRFSAAALPLIAVTSSVLTGCSGSPVLPNVESSSVTSPAKPDSAPSVLKGRLHGGQQPIAGAHIYLLAAGTTGYGSASTSLLTSVSYPGYTSVPDGNNNYYVTTDSAGNFQIADTCVPGQQVYVASVGGNAGGGPNSAANEIAILGVCPAAGNFDGTLTDAFISEISTVAAAYAAAAYATDTFHIGGPSATTIEQTGIANAFANAANLFDVQNINDMARTTTLGGNGTVPQAKIHTIANILAACINSTGPSSSACSNLFANAKSGGTTGSMPSDVTTAAINMAHNPWANVSALLPLQTAISPFSPQMTSSGSLAPSDFTIALSYTNAALGNNPSLAIDAGGAVWTVVPEQTAVTKLSPLGELLSGETGYAIGGGFAHSRALAFDTSNNLWVLGVGTTQGEPTATFAELSDVGLYQNVVTQPATILTIPLVPLSTNTPTSSTNLALDGAGNFYYGSAYTLISDIGNYTLDSCCTAKYNMAAGSVVNVDLGNMTPGTNFVSVNGTTVWATSGKSTVSMTAGTSKAVTGGGLNKALGVALDSAGDAWVVNSGNSTVSEFGSTGTAISGSSGFGSGLSTPKAIAVDGLGGVWVTNSGSSYSLSAMNSSGTVLGSGYADPNLSSAGALAIDPSGNVWVASASSSSISEFLGVAAPVVTPVAAAVSGGLVGARP